MKIVQEMGIGNHVRQGDILIIKVGESDSKFNPIEIMKDGILARGEITGHDHRAVATLEEVFSPADLEFLRKQQELLERNPLEGKKVLDGFPTVFKDKETEPRKRTIDGVEVVRDIIAKIHSPAPFYVVHRDGRAGVVPLDSKALVAAKDRLHEPIQLPHGLFEVIQQNEQVYTGTGTIKERRVID